MGHLLIVQHGDYGAAFHRMEQGLPETYRDQQASVDVMRDIAGSERVTTLAICDRQHEEELLPNLWSIGITRDQAYSVRHVWGLLNRLAPSKIILRTPHRYAMLWARWSGLPTLPIFANTFTSTTLRHRQENFLTRWLVSGANMPCVANHSLNASVSLQEHLGLAPERIVPWDRSTLNADSHPKPAAPDDRPFRVFYAGPISEAKGVGDLLEAAALLAREARPLHVDFAGAGDLSSWRRRAADLGVGNWTRFLGSLANAEVRQCMREADAVVVPSRHTYAEGLPNTLCEALASRTPVVVSDHPSFASRLRHNKDCLIFCAAAPQSLAAELANLRDKADLQIALSHNAPEALRRLPFGINWFTLIRTFVKDPHDATGWVARNSLAALQASQAAAAGMPEAGC